MDKPEGVEEPGWYPAPDDSRLERYWTGSEWSHETRKSTIPQQESIQAHQVSEAKKKHLGKFLFRTPIGSDWAFILYLSILALSLISSIRTDYFGQGSNFPMFLIFFEFLVTGIWVYLLMLLILVPRRAIDKKRGLFKEENPSNVRNISVNTKAKTIAIGVAVVLAIGFVASSELSRDTDLKVEGDKFFEIEQRISKVVGKWNVAATPIAEAIQRISEGSMGAAEARGIISDTSSKFAVIHNELNDECLAIPDYDITETGESGAISKAYNALQVTCDLIPQQSTEVLFLVSEQISPNGTQNQIDYHAEQLQKLRQQRFDALIEALKALRQYGSEGEVAQIDRILSYVENQQ